MERASAHRLALRYAARRGITDPLFNMREIAKQMLLLEDHLSLPYKSCPDCIRKHLMTIEALAEEAVSLMAGAARDKGIEIPFDAAEEAGKIAEKARRWIERLTDGEPALSVASEVREVRKVLTAVVADPREQASRVASAFSARHTRHQHL